MYYLLCRREKRTKRCRKKIKNPPPYQLQTLTVCLLLVLHFVSIDRQFFSVRVAFASTWRVARTRLIIEHNIKSWSACVCSCCCGTYTQKRWTRERKRALVFPRCVVKRTHITFLHRISTRISTRLARSPSRILDAGRRGKEEGSHFFTSLSP